MTHELKLRIEYADAVLDRSKPFEIRENDRGYQKGDVIRFKTFVRTGLHVPHPVEAREYRISYLIHGWGLKEGWCVFGTEEILDPLRPDRASYPLQIGDTVWDVFFNDDSVCWEVNESRVTGISMKGFRLSGFTDDPQSDDCLYDWDELGEDFFWRPEQAVAEAAKRNEEREA